MTNKVERLYQQMCQDWGVEESLPIIEFRQQVKKSNPEITMLINSANITSVEKKIALALKELANDLQMEGGRLFGYSEALNAVVKMAKESQDGYVDPIDAMKAIHMFFIRMLTYHQTTLKVAERNSEMTMRILGYVLGFEDSPY